MITISDGCFDLLQPVKAKQDHSLPELLEHLLHVGLGHLDGVAQHAAVGHDLLLQSKIVYKTTKPETPMYEKIMILMTSKCVSF